MTPLVLPRKIGAMQEDQERVVDGRVPKDQQKVFHNPSRPITKYVALALLNGSLRTGNLFFSMK